VDRISRRLANNFIRGSDSKLILNVNDIFNTNNIGGFNLSNFKMRFMNEFLDDVITDYNSSFLGSFVQAMFVLKETFKTQGKDSCGDLYMAITKFDSDFGYSLLKGE
jgi:hypothetical protein